jgi:hypothetical protein
VPDRREGRREIRLIRPALAQANVELRSGARVERLITDDSGRRIVAAEVVEGSVRRRITARLFRAQRRRDQLRRAAVALGQRQASARARQQQRRGRSSLHDAQHDRADGVHPLKRNTTRFPKTLAVHDFYFGERAGDTPLGSLQLLGKIREPMLRGPLPSVPRFVRSALAEHSVDWYAQSEDLPHPDSR